MRKTISTAVLSIVLLFAAVPLTAQFVTSSLTGRVSAGEQPAAGVRVTVTSPALQNARTTTTNADGRYFLDALPPGRYDVSFELAGHQSLIRPAVVELGRVARSDAILEPSEDEETVTSTATTKSVAETTAITSHFSREDLDRLPLWGGPLTVTDFAPSTFAHPRLDEVPMLTPVVGYDAVEQATVMRGALPAELDSRFGGVIALRTRSGGEQFTLSVRDTYFDEKNRSGHFYESESGGSIVDERLWFFGGGWSGDHAIARDADGLQLKLSGQPGASHHVVVSYLDTDVFGGDSSTTLLRYTGAWGDHTVAEALATRQSDEQQLFGDADEATGRLSYTSGSHVVSGGVSLDSRESGSETAIFLSDRWSWRNLNVNAGVRHEADETDPRIALAYDVRGNGRQAIAASYGEYIDAITAEPLDMASIGFVTAVGTGGTARVDAIRRESDGGTVDQLQFESRYRLFDRFELGAVYSLDAAEADDVTTTRNLGRAWAGAQIAIGAHEIGVTLSERYLLDWATDLALRYTVPWRRVAFTVGADAFDLLDDARSLRFWARVRL